MEVKTFWSVGPKSTSQISQALTDDSGPILFWRRCVGGVLQSAPVNTLLFLQHPYFGVGYWSFSSSVLIVPELRHDAWLSSAKVRGDG